MTEAVEVTGPENTETEQPNERVKKATTPENERADSPVVEASPSKVQPRIPDAGNDHPIPQGPANPRVPAQPTGLQGRTPR